jgi:hypothetical protein
VSRGPVVLHNPAEFRRTTRKPTPGRRCRLKTKCGVFCGLSTLGYLSSAVLALVWSCSGSGGGRTTRSVHVKWAWVPGFASPDFTTCRVSNSQRQH